jgi:GPH family glycoside/pentoside/hexuronide:cation symporter
MSIGFAVVASGAFGLSLLGAREKPATKNLTQPALLPALRTSFRNLSFRWFLIANLVKEFIFSVMTATIPFWAKYVLRIQGPASLLGAELSAELQNSLLLGSIFLMALPGIPFWTWIAKRYGGRRGWQAAQAAFGVSILGLYFANDFNQAIIGTAILGLSLAGLLIYPDLLIADVIDEDAKKMGARREGMYFGINGFIIRFAFTLQGLVTALVLGTTGYISATAQNAFPAQPEAAVLGIRSMVTLIPFVASMLTILALQRYPLHGKKLEAVRD